MSRALLILSGQDIKAKAHAWIDKAPWNTRVTFQGPKRTLDQSSKMWACLTDIATQLSWHGVTLSPGDWKLIMLDGLKQEMRLVPNMNGNGFVNLGRSSSDLSKEEASELIELILAFGTEQGVIFHDGQDTPKAENG